MKRLKVAIIPARGGSKRLPNKNILKFKGQPIINFTIKAAIKSKVFDEIIISTDSKKIKHLVSKFPITIHDRPKYLSTGNSTINQLCEYLIKSYKEKGITWSEICVLYPTAPMRNSGDIKKVMSLLKKDINFSVAVTKFDHYPHHALIENKKKLIPMWPKLINSNKFKHKKIYVDNGSTYAAKVNYFLKYKTFLGPKLKGYEMPSYRSIDVDELNDYLLLKKIFMKNHNLR